MKWILFTGTWRLTNNEVEQDVRAVARQVFEAGDALVTGGATGVDYYAMSEWILHDITCCRIRIFIPAKLDHFIADYSKNWKHAPITSDDIQNIEKVLRHIQEKNPAAILEVKKEEGDITQEEYDVRHNEEVTFSDEVYAFQVNNSSGTGDTIKKAEAAGLPVTLHKKYTIDEL
jgi:CO dehydrogenase/acetyl-CoA synthase beta subunit